MSTIQITLVVVEIIEYLVVSVTLFCVSFDELVRLAKGHIHPELANIP